MTGGFEAVSALFGEAALVGLLTFLRVGAAIAVLPGAGEVFLPARIRLALAVAFTLALAPAAAGPLAPFAGAAEGGLAGRAVLAGLLVGEVAIGLAFGLLVRLFVFALQTAGTIVAQSTSLAQLFGFGGADPMPSVSQLLVLGGLALAVASGLHVRLAVSLLWTYEAFPPGALPGATALRFWFLDTLSMTFALAFSLAAPFLAASLLYNVALGVINRAMPQLMVTFVGAPAMTFGALALMVLAVPAAVAIWTASLEAFLARPDGGLR